MEFIRHIKLFFLFPVLALLILTGCDPSVTDIDVDEIPVEISFSRTDVGMYHAVEAFRLDSNADASKVYSENIAQFRPFLLQWLYFGNDSAISDSIIAVDMKDFLSHPQVADLFDSVHVHFPESWSFQDQLKNPLKRFAYYFPMHPVRKVTTFVTGYSHTGQGTIDQVWITPEYIGLGLHFFMGESFPFYPPDIPLYLRRRFTPDNIPYVVCEQLLSNVLPGMIMDKQPLLIDLMVQEGIRLNLMQKLLPDAPDSLILKYTTPQMEWVDYYEGRIYKQIMPNLFATDVDVQKKFMNESPYTADLSRDSAPRLGYFIGMKIVDAWWSGHPEVSPDSLAKIRDYESIFRDSHYRPSSQNE